MLFQGDLLELTDRAKNDAKSYDLGNGTSARSPDEAMDLFISREFPEIMAIKNGSSHDVRFIPDTYIYKELTEKVLKHCAIKSKDCQDEKEC